MKAEDVYDRRLRDLRPYVGTVGELCWWVAGRPLNLLWVLRSNRLWRGGRVFLLCPDCRRPAARLYLVTADMPSPACRTCLSLAYESQTRNYRDDAGLLRAVGLSCREFAKHETELKRQAARRVARERAARRRHPRVGLPTSI